MFAVTRLLVHVEGQTEEQFVNELLSPHLQARGYTSVSTRLIGNARQRGQRGGIRPWSEVRKTIVNHLRQDPGSSAATMVDYYGLPRTGPTAWPGREEALRAGLQAKPEIVENALLEDVARIMGRGFDSSRFIPFLTMHEFEALLFSDCERFALGIDKPEMTGSLQAIRDAFTNPEEIDDSPDTAPSKRVVALIPGYQEPLMGTLAALEIGLVAMRAECPHFDAWVKRLETHPKSVAHQ
ncbi:MAG: DUF4276 family protein [Deltaproteobacteria bacterium]|nr:DUF4276 family protein [Deltaproteobacteria bacterium]